MKKVPVKTPAPPFQARSLAAAALLFCLGSLLPGAAVAVPASPSLVEVSQPDGSKFRLALKGDEFYHRHEDDKGYTILKDTSTGAWFYGEKDPAGGLKAGKHKVGAADPAKAGLKKHLTDAQGVARAKALRDERNYSPRFHVAGVRTVTGAESPKKATILTGTMRNLVILAAFSDLPSTFTQAQFNSLFNTVGYTTDGAVGSVKDFYSQVSYNKLLVESTVFQWVTLPHGYSYYGANDFSGNDVNPRQMVIDAINAVDAAGFNFADVDGNNDGQVDGLTIIHSGRGEESGYNDTDYIWSHQWALASAVTKDGKTMQTYHTEPEVRGDDGDPAGITRIGVICHENGHFLGLPDLYDYDGSSRGAGQLCLMAGGSWNGALGDGASPAHMSAWCKKYLGWATATQVSTYGTKTLPRIQDNDTALYLFRNDNFGANEYFLMENRQGYGFDSQLPGSTRGILIWHVDEDVPEGPYGGYNEDETHYLVDLEEASGTQHLEQDTNSGDDYDYFRSNNLASFTDTGTPHSRSYLGYNLGLPIQSISASGVTMSFTIPDETNPTAIATVYDGATAGSDIAKTGASTELSANWTPSSDPETGLKAYWYAIGTVIGATNLTGWRNNGLLTS
ncbi:MAG: hypothetical protein A3J79_11995, partial [Elusimicrobia bacterium RIFOXYB2_FULL_62_6]